MIMNELNFKVNYYALLIAIFCNKTAKNALIDMGICPDNEKER